MKSDAVEPNKTSYNIPFNRLLRHTSRSFSHLGEIGKDREKDHLLQITLEVGLCLIYRSEYKAVKDGSLLALHLAVRMAAFTCEGRDEAVTFCARACLSHSL
jgi:hypothetical protein